MKRPSVFEHMMIWGVGSGFLLSILFAGLLLDAIWVMIFPITWIMALFFGAIPGVFIGFVVSIPIKLLLRHVPMPFTREAMLKKMLPVYVSTFLLSVATLSIIAIPMVTDGYAAILLTPFIAGIAATYAAHRYLFRLRLWSERYELLRRHKYGIDEDLLERWRHRKDGRKKKKKRSPASRNEILDAYYDYEQSLSDEQQKQEQHS